jgi:hypothetical protein
MSNDINKIKFPAMQGRGSKTMDLYGKKKQWYTFYKQYYILLKIYLFIIF